MKRALSVLVLLLISGHASAEAPVYFPDLNLKTAVENELQVYDPTPTDMLALINFQAQAANITDLTGLEHATNLQTMMMRFNHVRSLAPLGNLYNLRSLAMMDNDIRDISALSGLTNLTELDIHNNQISDISALSGLVNVWFLALRENPLSDISPLSGMHNLAELSLLNTRVSDISPLADLKSLRYVDLRDCPLNNEAYAIYLPQIRANNPGATIDVNTWGERTLRLSSTFGGSVVEPGEGESRHPFESFVHVEAAAYPGFVFDHWTGSFLLTANPTDICMVGDYSFRAHFLSPRDTLYVDDDAPYNPNADGSPENPISRIQDAIDVAGEGVTIFVAPGVYRENIKLNKGLCVTAIDPRHPNGGPCAIIEAMSANPVVTIDAGAGSNCSLSGFVITRGQSRTAGGIRCSGASPTLSHCLIVGNRCTDPNGAVLHFEQSRAVMTNCTVADNYAGQNGAGLTLDDSDITVVNSILWGNYPSEIRTGGTSDPSIHHCCVRGSWPGLGNTDSDPLPARPGRWADPDNPNMTLGRNDPGAIWMDGDYHLKSQAGRWDPVAESWLQDHVTSPAIDAGDPASPIGCEPTPHGGIVNLGAYGGTSEASLSR